jgi:hypothetical protein
MKEFLIAVAAGLVVLAIAGLAAWVWKPTRRRIQAWFARNEEIAAEAKKQVAVSELADLRKGVIERARLLNVDLCIRTEGVRPIVATYTDGRRIPFYPDHPSYVRAMGGPAPDLQGRVGRPKPPVSRWSRQQCVDWLKDHPI